MSQDNDDLHLSFELFEKSDIEQEGGSNINLNDFEQDGGSKKLKLSDSITSVENLSATSESESEQTVISKLIEENLRLKKRIRELEAKK
jgi:hypothetical protein